MRTIPLVALLLGVLAAPVAAETLTVGGQPRTFNVYMPPAIAAARKPAPLVIALHGGRGSGVQMQEWLGLDRVAAREGFVVAYPDGLANSWNDGRSAIYKTGGQAPDDVGFLVTVAQTLVDRGVAQKDRIYVTGASNGGMMSYRLACETKGVFAGFAAMIANLSVELGKTCAAPPPARVLIMNGTADPLMPFEGGQVARNDRGEVLSTAVTFERWQKAGGCTGVTAGDKRPDRDATDGSHVVVTRATGCQGGAGVWLYTVVGGGHQMPSITRPRRPLIDRFLGTANRDIEAAEEVWAFFAARQ